MLLYFQLKLNFIFHVFSCETEGNNSKGLWEILIVR